jgi:N6-L-threonylcarbamoyladenine synthase
MIGNEIVPAKGPLRGAGRFSVMVNSPRTGPRRLLALESSCDETAAAVIDEELRILSSVVASQTKLHKKFGGVVPEVASRAHVERILPVIDEALRQAGARLDELAAVSVVTHPGLVGSLLVGLTAAKTLALLLKIPLVAVNHIEAHIFSCRMHAARDVFPAIGLVVSGGHTNLYDCPEPVGFELLGSTIDDAAGEAFDKIAAVLGLDYPGGPAIERAAKAGNARAFRFPRTFVRDRDRLEFSFSGLKTAVLYEVAGKPPGAYDPPRARSAVCRRSGRQFSGGGRRRSDRQMPRCARPAGAENTVRRRGGCGECPLS